MGNNLRLHAFIQQESGDESGIYRGVLDHAINPKNIERIPTGVRSVDAVLHGGIPRGQLSIICGQTHTGKSTLSLQLMTKAFMRDIPVLYLGFESQPGEIHFELQRMLAGPGQMVRTGPGEWGIDSAAVERIDKFLYDRYLTLKPRKNGMSMPMSERHGWMMSKIREFIAVTGGRCMIMLDPLQQLTAQGACSPEMKMLKTEVERQAYFGVLFEDIAQSNDCWVVLVAHYKKGGDDSTYSVSGPDAIAGSSVIPNSAGVIVSYERYSEVWQARVKKKAEKELKDANDKNDTEAAAVAQAKINKIDGHYYDDKRCVKIWKNRGWGTLETRGLELGFEPASHRIGSHDPDYWDDKYDYEKIMNSPEWHDYMDDPIDPVTAKTKSELQTEAEILLKKDDGDIQTVIEAMERSMA